MPLGTEYADELVGAYRGATSRSALRCRYPGDQPIGPTVPVSERPADRPYVLPGAGVAPTIPAIIPTALRQSSSVIP